MCVRDGELSKLEGQCDDLRQKLSNTQAQLLEKEQELAMVQDTLQENKVGVLGDL